MARAKANLELAAFRISMAALVASMMASIGLLFLDFDKSAGWDVAPALMGFIGATLGPCLWCWGVIVFFLAWNEDSRPSKRTAIALIAAPAIPLAVIVWMTAPFM